MTRVCIECSGPFFCKERCRKCYGRVYYRRNARKILDGNKRWRDRNLDKVKAGEKKRYEKNGEAMRAAQRKRSEMRRAENNEYARRYRTLNAEKVHAAISKWVKSHPDRMAEYTATRRARKRVALGSHTQAEWEAVCKKQGGRCARCHQEKPLTRDHIVPLSKGGSDYIINIQGLCKSCNSSKRAALVRGTQVSIFDRIPA